jgi:hypothetical protein
MGFQGSATHRIGWKKHVFGRKEMGVSIAGGRRNPHLDLRLPGIAVSDAETVGWGLAHSVYGLV